MTDASGAPVPQAAITATNTDNNERSNGVTATDGNFSISGLAPGSYRLEAEAAGFKRLSRQNVQVAAGTPVRVELSMETGNASDTVAVTGEASLIQDDSSQVAKAYTSRTVREIPLLDRNFQQLTELMPGVTPPSVSVPLVIDPQRNRYWQTNGQQVWTNRQNVDGVENDEPFYNLAIRLQPLETIQQMNVITSTYDASQGRAAGTIVNVVTRSGTNVMHGSLFAFNTNSFFSARDYFNPVGLPQARTNLNQFGATVGGPIVRDHTFFFLSYEGDYFRNQNPTVTTVPTASFLNGDFSAVPGLTLYNPATGVPFPNNVIPSSLISPIARNLLSYFPQANSQGFENNLFTSVPYRDDGNRADGKLDHRFNEHAALFARYGYSNFRTVNNSPLGSVLGANNLGKLRAHNAEIGFDTTVRGFNADFRLGYNRYEDLISANGSYAAAGQFGFTNPNVAAGMATLPNIAITGLSPIGTPANYPQRNVDNNFNVATNWGGRLFGQNIRFGVDLWQINVDGFQNNAYGPQGGYIFGTGVTSTPSGSYLGQFGQFPNAFASFLLGAPSQIGVAPTQFSSNYQYQASGYLQDKINLFSRFTLELGVRYDFFTPLQPKRAAGNTIFNPATDTLLPLATNSVDARGNVQYSTRNIAPRVGFAYRFTNHTVVRGGYGINYFQMPLLMQSRSFLQANTGVLTGVAGSYGSAGSFGALPLIPSSGTLASNAGVYYTPSDVQTPYVQNYSFQLQQDLRYGMLLDIGYVGNLGRQLPYVREMNAAMPGTGVAGLPYYTQFGRTGSVLQQTTGLTSNYNSLQANLTKRFSQGLSFSLAYTYSKALDYSDSLYPLVNNLNVRSNYGPADFDRTHVLTLTHVWQLPFGAGTHFASKGVLGKVLGPWQLNGVLRYATGLPFTPTADPVACACPGNTPVANVQYLGTTNVITYNPFYFGYFPYVYSYANYGFTQPAAGQLGNAGRNVLRSENITNYDLSLFRSFVFLEQSKLEFRAEAFNLANSPHFGAPIANVNSANFGQYTSTLSGLGFGSRTLQLALRLVF